MHLSLHLHETEVRYLYNTAETLLTLRVVLSVFTGIKYISLHLHETEYYLSLQIELQSRPHFNIATVSGVKKRKSNSLIGYVDVVMTKEQAARANSKLIWYVSQSHTRC